MANDMSQAAGRIAVAFACFVALLPSPSFAHSVGAQPAAQSKTAAPARQAPLAKPLWAELNPEQQLALAPLAAYSPVIPWPMAPGVLGMARTMRAFAPQD